MAMHLGGMIMAKKDTSDYIYALRYIRPFTRGFDPAGGYDIRSAAHWTSAKKASITRYDDIIRRLTATPYYLYRPRNEERLREALKMRGVESYRKLKVGFIPVPYDPKGKVRPKITYGKRGLRVKVESHGSAREYLLFENFGVTKEHFLTDPEGALEIIFAKTNFNFYNILCGENELGKGAPEMMKPADLYTTFVALLEKYGDADTYDPDDPGSSYVGNWLFGLIGYQFKTVKQAEKYVISRLDFSNARKKYNTKKKNILTAIEKIESDIVRINRHARISPWISRIAQLAITKDLKITKNKKTIKLLLEARAYIKTHKKKKIPTWLREYLIAEKNKQISDKKATLDKLTRERLNLK